MKDQHEQIRYYLHLGRETLSANERVALDEHLQACAACRAYADRLSAMQAALRDTFHQCWDGMQSETQLDVEQLAQQSRGHLIPRLLGYATGIAALIGLVLLLQAFFKVQTQTVNSPLPTAYATDQAQVLPTPPPIPTQPTPTPPSGHDFYQLQRLTDTLAGAYRPAVSPDGQRVAYASEGDGNWDIYVLDLATKAETRLTADPLPDMAPAWSPDGTHLAYQHNVPSANGPVLVDYTVMNADGSNKSVVASGAHWLKNEAPAWSPASDRIAFSDSNGIVIVEVLNQREIRRLTPSNNQVYYVPVWFDEDHLLYIDSGQLQLVAVNTGTIQQALGPSWRVDFGMAANPRVVYVGQNGPVGQVSEVQIDGSLPKTLAVFPGAAIEHAALSPDGQFVAVQTDGGIYVIADGLPASWQNAPLFHLDQIVPPNDLLSVAWLPDSSGFVFVSAVYGKPDLYLATLKRSAIDYLKSLTAPALSTPAPEPPEPSDPPIIKVSAVSFTPDPVVPLDGQRGFEFGAEVAGTSPININAHIVAFAVRPGERASDCSTQSVPTERPFWANQSNFAPGQFKYGQRFIYADDVPEADRLVVRVNLIEPGVNGRILYCTQHIYTLTTADNGLLGSSTPIGLTPFPTPTPYIVLTPFPTPTAYVTPLPNYYFFYSEQYAVQFQYPTTWQVTNTAKISMAGPDGFFQLSMMNGDPADLMNTCRSEANRPLPLFGSATTIETLTVDGQEACLILPAGGQLPDETAQHGGMLIARYPQPNVSQFGDRYAYLMLIADEAHLHTIVSTVRFLPQFALTPHPTVTPYMLPPPPPTQQNLFTPTPIS